MEEIKKRANRRGLFSCIALQFPLLYAGLSNLYQTLPFTMHSCYQGDVQLWMVIPLTNSHALQVTKIKELITYHSHDIRLDSNPEFRHRFHNCTPENEVTFLMLMLYGEIMAVFSQIHTKHINTAVWAERRIAES